MGGLGFFIADLVLIAVLAVAVAMGLRLMRQLASLRAHQAEMERIIAAFNVTVQRAEGGIKGLKQTARTAGDDLERLIDKANNLRDELQFLTDSADQIAARLSDKAAIVTRQGGSAATETTDLKTLLTPTARPAAPREATGLSQEKKQADFTAEKAEPRAMQIVREVLAVAERGFERKQEEKRPAAPAAATSPAASSVPSSASLREAAPPPRAREAEPTPSSVAERELLRALQNLK